MQPVGFLIPTNLDNKWKWNDDYLFLTGHSVWSTRLFSVSVSITSSRLYRSENVRWPQRKAVRTKLIGSTSTIVVIRAAAVCSSCRPSSNLFCLVTKSASDVDQQAGHLLHPAVTLKMTVHTFTTCRVFTLPHCAEEVLHRTLVSVTIRECFIVSTPGSIPSRGPSDWKQNVPQAFYSHTLTLLTFGLK